MRDISRGAHFRLINFLQICGARNWRTNLILPGRNGLWDPRRVLVNVGKYGHSNIYVLVSHCFYVGSGFHEAYFSISTFKNSQVNHWGSICISVQVWHAMSKLCLHYWLTKTKVISYHLEGSIPKVVQWVSMMVPSQPGMTWSKIPLKCIKNTIGHRT